MTLRKLAMDGVTGVCVAVSSGVVFCAGFLGASYILLRLWAAEDTRPLARLIARDVVFRARAFDMMGAALEEGVSAGAEVAGLDWWYGQVVDRLLHAARAHQAKPKEH